MAEQRWPLHASLLGAAGYIAAVQTGIYDPAGNSLSDALVLVITLPAVAALSVALGVLCRRLDSLIGIGVLTVALQWGGPDPFPAMITIGFWLVGRAVRSHRILTRTLRVRAFELESGRAAYAQESLRYERIRIARELHDIVAHSLSVIVIQAGAGRRLPPDDATANGHFDTIRTVTDQMQIDLDGLSRLLDDSGEHDSSITRRSLEQLLARTAETGSPVHYRLPDDFDQLPGQLTGVVYHVVQEALTNAIKHAPGAPIDVSVTTTGTIGVDVTNDLPRPGQPTPTVPGFGRGIAGLAERVQIANGTITSGPTPQGGWQLSAELPR